MLATVILSSGRKRHYQYEGARIAQISDGDGHALSRNHHDWGLLTWQEFQDKTSHSYGYQATCRHYPDKVTVTSPDQMTKELSAYGFSAGVRATTSNLLNELALENAEHCGS
jgi:hypothetical protein